MVKIAVLVKASLNLNLIKVESSGLVNVDETPLSISEYDKNAIEEGIRLKEKYGGKVSLFSALTWGPLQKKILEFERIIREGLSMGADEAYIIIDENLINSNILITSFVISEFLKKTENFDIYITGEASMDISSYQFASRIGTFLNIPIITFARKIEIKDGSLIVYRDLEDEIQIVKSNFPVVISVTGEINQPRLPTLKQILQSKKKPVKKFSLKDLNIEIKKPEFYQEIRILPVKRKNIIIEEKNLEEISEKLLNKLIEEGVLKT